MNDRAEFSKKTTSFYVPLGELIIHEDENYRKHYEDIESLANSIKNEGQITALNVTKTEDGKWKLCSGFRRVRAFKHLFGDKWQVAEVECKEVSASDAKDFAIKNLTENIQRNQLSQYELAHAIHMLHSQEGHGLTQQKIAARLGMTQSWVSQLYKVYISASEPLREAWAISGSVKKQNEIPFTVIAEWVKDRPDEDGQMAYLNAYRLGKDEVELPPEDGDETGESTTKKVKGNTRPTFKEVKDMLSRLISLAEKASEEEDEETYRLFKDRAGILKWVTGELKTTPDSKPRKKSK
jgi:ParB/RepB/Spo0J family partition protein